MASNNKWLASLATTIILSLPATTLLAEPVPTNTFVNFESAHVHPLDRTPDGSKLLAVNTANNTLEVFVINSDGSLRNSASIPVGHDPISVRVRNNNEAWVANVISDTVSIVDLNTNAVIRTLQTENEPSDIVFAGSPLRAFVSNAERESIQIFNLSNLNAIPQEVLLIGEQPRAMAVSPDGNTVYTAFFESGNQTTVIAGNDFIANGGLSAPGSGTTVVPNDIRNPAGPYGGRVPVPNSGTGFSPAINPALPPKNDTQSLVVKKQPNGRWLDDNNGDWTNIVSGGAGNRTTGWDLRDRDVAILNANTLNLTYQSTLGNILMAMDVNPVSGRVTVVGTDALNHIRFEPNLNGTFLRVNVSEFAPSATNANVRISDLNAHLDYNSSTVSNALKTRSIGDPRGVAWRANGTTAYVTGMGSNNVVVLNANNARAVPAPIAVGEGPTGIVLDEARQLGFVLNKFDASISVLNLRNGTETAQYPFFDPTPQVIKTGRQHLYNTHQGSGNGTISCASCHVDGKWDRLGWDLGNPAGEMNTVDGTNFHPLKGLKVTQTLIDTVNPGMPLHWRGDRGSFSDFHTVFGDLKGIDTVREEIMKELEDFMAETYHPPNPYRRAVNNPGTELTGTLRGPGTTFQNTGVDNFQGPGVIGLWLEACGGCHRNSSGKGPSGESFRAAQYVGNNNIAADLRTFYRKLGFYTDSPDSTVGFGWFSDGIGHTAERVRTGYLFDYHGVLFGWSGGGITHLRGTVTSVPASHPSQDSHYKTGQQETLNGSIGRLGAVNAILDTANDSKDLVGVIQRDLGLIVKGIYRGEQRGFVYQGNNQYRADSGNETVTHAQLIAAAQANNNQPLTWMLVHDFVAQRAGIDRDADGTPDADEGDVDVDVLPQGNPDAVAVTSSAEVTINPVANDTGSGLVLQAPSAWSWKSGSVSLTNNQLRYKPKAGFNGEDKIWYTVIDSQGRSSWSVIVITVTGNGGVTDVPPNASPDIVNITSSSAVTINPLANDTGNGLVLQAPNAWSLRGGRVELVSNRLRYTPKSGFNGEDKIWYTISDSQGRNGWSVIVINVSGNGTSNDVLPSSSEDNVTTTTGTTITIDVLANDRGNGLTLTAPNAWSLNGGSVALVNNKLTYKSKAGFTGSDKIWYTFSDSQGRTNSGQVNITVNAGNTTAPFPIANAESYTVPKNSTSTFNILNNDTPSGLTIDTLYEYTSKGGRTTRIRDNMVSYTPKTDFTGVDDFWYVVIDAQGRKNSAKVTINVSP